MNLNFHERPEIKAANFYVRPLIASLMLLIIVFAGCKKADLAGGAVTGEGLVPFSLQSPASGTTVVLNAATPNATLDFVWTASVPGIKTPPNYKWVVALKTNGSIDTPLVALPSGNKGFDTKISITYQQMDSALKAMGIAAGAQVNLIWSILADNGSTKLLAQNVYNISITRFQDGASPFFLLGPVSTTTPLVINPGSTADTLTFNWTRSTPATSANPVNYVVWVYQDNAASTPVFSIKSNGGGHDSLLSVTYAQLSDSLNAHGLTDVSQMSSLKWTVAATSGGWVQWSNYTNQLYLIREIDLFLAGSFQSPTQWDPPTGIQMIPDSRSGLQNNMFWEYIYLPANAQFKVTQGRSWTTSFGGDGAGNLVLNGGNNFSVTTAGVYRISVNIHTLTYNISPGRMGFVGDAVTGVGWNPPGVFPASQMGFIGTNKFLGIYNFGAGGWKMIDNNQWNDGSNSVSETRSYGSSDGTTLSVNGPNMPAITTAGFYRLIWDGTNIKSITYTSLPGTLYLIGDATAGGWDNNNAALPAMTYQGNGVWQITGVPLTGGKQFKFLLEKGTWNYNYGGPDPNTNALAGGSITEGGGNIQVPVTGTYTVTLDEYKRTYTVN